MTAPTPDERRIRQLTIEAQLARDFADRLGQEADAWLAVATGKRAKAVEYQMKADALTAEAGLIRAGKAAARKTKQKDLAHG